MKLALPASTERTFAVTSIAALLSLAYVSPALALSNSCSGDGTGDDTRERGYALPAVCSIASFARPTQFENVGRQTDWQLRVDQSSDAAPVARLRQGQINQWSASSPEVMSGTIEAWEGPFTVEKMVDHLVDFGYERSPEGQKIEQQIRHLSGMPAKGLAATKDGFQHALEYQGFEPSERASRLILDDKYKVRNIAWAEYDRQKFVDKIHVDVVTAMMQIAEGLGTRDTASGAKIIETAKTALNTLVGEPESEKTIKALADWLSHAPVDSVKFDSPTWNSIERRNKLEEVIKIALSQDPVMKEVSKKLRKYEHPGKIKSAAAHLVDTSLNGIALLSPGFALPLTAEALETGWKVGTGGTEENKLERELLLDKRIQSRLKILSAEASLALDNYRYAQVTRNTELFSFSQEVLGNLTGRDNRSAIVSNSDYSAAPIIPEISESNPATAHGAAGLKQKGQTVLKQLAPFTSL